MKKVKSRPAKDATCALIGIAGLIEAYVRAHYRWKTVVVIDCTFNPNLFAKTLETLHVSWDIVPETVAVADQAPGRSSNSNDAGIVGIVVCPNKKAARELAEHFWNTCRTYIFSRNGECHRHTDVHDPADGVLTIDMRAAHL